MIFGKQRQPDGTRNIYLFGIKIFSYKRTQDTIDQYKKTFQRAGYKVSRTPDGICITGCGLKILGRADNTLWTGRAVLGEEEYDFDMDGEDCVVIDVGMNIGMTSLYLARKDFITNIYSFEPFVPTFSQAQNNLDLNKKLAKKITAYNFGLSDKDDVLTISYNPTLPGAMSSMPNKSATSDNTHEEKIEIKRASDILGPLFKQHNDRKIMMKIDVEGAEREILPDLAKSGLLKSVDLIIMEYHDNYYEPLIELLQKNGFDVRITSQKEKYGTGMITARR